MECTTTNYFNKIEINMKKIKCYFSKTKNLNVDNQVKSLGLELFKKLKNFKDLCRAKSLMKENHLMRVSRGWVRKMSHSMSF